MAGKVIASVGTDGEFLLIQTTNGQCFKIKWIDNEPVLDSIDVSIVLKI
jgi:hypothetical protein